MSTRKNIKYVKSCGFIAYKNTGNEILYLVIKSLNGDIGFPKGHTEIGESELQTAVRELKEETGIEVSTISGFRYKIEYPLGTEKNAIKQCVYFLGKVTLDSIVCQKTEVDEAKFIPYDEALDLLTFKETKDALKSADIFLKSI